MTSQELQTFFESMVEDSLDQDTFLLLLNEAKNRIEGERDWEMLKVLDSSQSAGSGAKTLPTRYSHTVAMYVGTALFAQVPFEQQKLFQNTSNRWYLDLANGVFYLLGSSLSGTINHFYIRNSPELTISSSPIWPERFHKRLAFEVAKDFFPIDQGDKNRDRADEWAAKSEMIRRSMVDWDVNLQKRTIENGVPIGDGEPIIDLGTF